MSHKLFANYRKIFEQAWMPIFGNDPYDTEMLLTACELAGLKVIEYTLRRHDADAVIPTLKERFPNSVVLVGSTIDDEKIIAQMKEKHPQLKTVQELAPYVDGFVSMLPYTNETLDAYRTTHISIPCAETAGEALRQLKHGASFIKVLGPDFSFSKQLHAVPTFGYCPTYITGGVTRERMSEAFAAGNILCAAGFDVVLRNEDSKTLTAQKVADLLYSFVETAKVARLSVNPCLRDIENMSDEMFLKVLPNYCSIR